MKKIVSYVVLASLITTPALADDKMDDGHNKGYTSASDTQVYANVSVGLNRLGATEDDVRYTSDAMINGYVRAGVKFAKYFGVEGEYGIGLSEWSEDRVSFKVDSQIAGYVVGRYPLGDTDKDKGDVFVRVGYHKSDIALTFDGIEGEYSDEGIAYGLGATYFFKDKHGVRGEISAYSMDDGFEYAGLNLGYVFRF